MAEFAYQDIEAWNTATRLAANVGRLKVGSNLKASADCQARAFDEAGLAAGLIAEASMREGAAGAGLLRDARGALARCRSWLHVLARVTNEDDSVFSTELDLAELCSRQLGAMLRTYDRPQPRPAYDRGAQRTEGARPAPRQQAPKPGQFPPGPRGSR